MHAFAQFAEDWSMEPLLSHRALEQVRVSDLSPYPANARTHSQRQLRQIAKSIKRFGFLNPILIDDAGCIIAGHGRVEAAKFLELEFVPVLRLSHLSAADKKAYIIADNRLAELAGWDKGILALELQALVDLDFPVEEIGFEIAEVDLILSEADNANADKKAGPEDDIPSSSTQAVTRMGDIWECGRHRILCGDARSADAYQQLLTGEHADMMFTDPPYNVAISGHVRTDDGHREFAMASGEMSKPDFEAFLEEALTPAATTCRDGAIAFVCMDWRHMGELLKAGGAVFSELKNVCVWAKTNGGMGSLYRSQHELVFVFKQGQAPHCNNVELGKFGRNRTNVWTYAGVNVFKQGRDAELSMHPTVKPVALVEEAIKDVSRRGEIVLDPFGGSGTTLIAAERCGRRARLIEFDPLYCDVIVRRFEAYTGKQARLAASQETFEVVSGR
ncbi:MAG: site-specific DNA-methyltransferase [Terricaulis sp.]